MSPAKPLTCKICQGNRFQLKYEATYVYSYVLDGDAPGFKNTKELLPFMYDSREQQDSKQYLHCDTCGFDYPCYFTDWDQKSGFAVLQEVIDHTPVTHGTQKAPVS